MHLHESTSCHGAMFKSQRLGLNVVSDNALGLSWINLTKPLIIEGGNYHVQAYLSSIQYKNLDSCRFVVHSSQ